MSALEEVGKVTASEEVDKAAAYQKGREILTKSIEAVQKGDLEALKVLLSSETKEKLNEISEGKNRKLIHFASIFGHTSIIDWILSNGGDGSLLDDDGNSIASLAVYSERKEALEFILEKLPEQLYHKNSKLMSLLHIAAENSNFEIIEMLLARGLDINMESLNGTPLELAVIWKKMDVAKLLLERGADPNGSKGKYFPPPLVMAASMENVQGVEMLLSHGADISLTGYDKITALEVACEFAFSFIDLLISKGAKVTGRVIEAAYKNKKHDVVKKFLNVAEVAPFKVEIDESKKQQAEELKAQGNKEFHNKNFIAATELYTQAIGLYPCSIYYSNRSQAFIFQSKFDEALEDARISRALDKNNFKAYLKEAQALFELGRYIESAACYYIASTIDSNPSISTMFLSALKYIN
ncbi:hypothetical protein SteCoe_33218 [Stentor coeruleus]|uniref:Ankyrin repeat protein n=1 Tax=Stentor coeruleus TaxID=5963 RepID=A0A1R2AX83_9CILI|nr:hypothetical protein SteCoe_33218 [Stentor coeruleus]